MAVLEKIRVKFGIAASIIIALGLLSFIIDPSEIVSAFNSMSSKYDVGEINGKAISYADFQAEAQRMSTINELMTGSSAQSAQQQAQTRDAAWQDLIYRYLFVKKANDAGIYVGSDEIVDLTSGDNLSPLVAQNPAFFGEDGQFSKDQLLKFIQNMDSDETGRLGMYWDFLQNSIRNQQYYEKYSSLFTQRPSKLLVRKAVEENNTTTDVEFVMVPFGYQTDTTIVVSDKEIKDYYNSHKKFYEQAESRDIEYVVYEVVPSAKDIQATRDQVNSLYDEFATTDNMKSFLVKNSDRALSNYWYKAGELRSISPAIEDFVWSGKAGASDVITGSGNKFYVAKVMDSKNIPDSAYVKHILLQGENAAHLADSLLGVVRKGGDFSSVAAVYSADKGSQADGEFGNIGWMTQNYMIPGFESVLTAETGKPFILNTQYGSHVVLVTRKTAPVAKKQVAILEKEALASKETFNDFYAKANKFATAAAGSYENYRKAVDTLGVYSHPVNKMLESSDRLGSIDNTKEITRWAFENKAGKVSDIKTIDNNYFFIATVKGVHKEGYAKISEVASQIRQQLYQEKLAAKKAAEIAADIEGLDDLQAIAEKLGTTVSTQNDIAFASMGAQGLDPKFIGALSVAPEGKVCGPVAGSIGVYVYKVTGRETGSFFTEDDARSRDEQMSRYSAQMIIPTMMQDADIKDNRARFY